MLRDCGITTDRPDVFKVLHGRWRTWEHEHSHELMVLVFTPGIPTEWVHAVFGWTWARARRGLRDMIRAADPVQMEELGKVNAESVEQGDGLKMLERLPLGYKGAVPLYSQLELQNDRRSCREIGEALGGFKGAKVWRWKRHHVFDPLTGLRLVAPRGAQSAL